MHKADLQHPEGTGHIKQILAYVPKACVLRGFVHWAHPLGCLGV